MRVNFVFYGHQDWVLGDIASQVERHTDLSFVRSEKPVEGADVYHILRPNWAAEQGLTLPFPCLVSHHGQGVRDGKLLYGPETMDAFRDATLIAVLNTSDIAELAQAGVDCDKCRYIPHGVDLEAFRPSPQHRQGERCRVLRVGRRYAPAGRPDSEFSSENKGAATLRGILQRLDPDRFEVVLLAGGDSGWEQEAAVAQARGLPCDVINVPYERYPEVYQTCDAYLITSRSEGGPASLLEAMACGLPVVATPTGMAKDFVVAGESGLFYQFNDAEGAVKALECVAERGWWGDKSQIERSRTVALPFSWASIAQRYRAAYEELHNPVHSTTVRTWYGGRFAKTRCLNLREMHSPLYARLRRDWRLTGKGFFRDWEYAAVLAELWPRYPETPLGRTLVVGANNDLLALALCQSFGESVTCVDPAGFEHPWWFENAAGRITEKPPAGLDTSWPTGPRYIPKEVQLAGLPEASFDTVISVSVMEHVPDPAAFLGAVARALKPNGRAVLTVEYGPEASEHIPQLRLTTMGERGLNDLVAGAGLRFVGGCDWRTREGRGTVWRAMPPHLRERFGDGQGPYLCPLIMVLTKGPMTT